MASDFFGTVNDVEVNLDDVVVYLGREETIKELVLYMVELVIRDLLEIDPYISEPFPSRYTSHLNHF